MTTGKTIVLTRRTFVGKVMSLLFNMLSECQRIDAFELWCWRRLLRVPWTARRSNQSWVFTGRTDAEAEAPIFWPPDVKNWLIRRDPDAGNDWRQEEKRTTEDKMVGWHHRLNGHEFEEALGIGDGQGGLVCCGSWGCKESDTTEWLNWTELNWKGQTQLSDWTELDSWFTLLYSTS